MNISLFIILESLAPYKVSYNYQLQFRVGSNEIIAKKIFKRLLKDVCLDNILKVTNCHIVENIVKVKGLKSKTSSR